MGWSYKYASFSNASLVYDRQNHGASTPGYLLTETSESVSIYAARISWGCFFGTFKPQRPFGQFYVSFLPGIAYAHVMVDSMYIESPNYYANSQNFVNNNPHINKHQQLFNWSVEIGFNYCFGIGQRNEE